MKILPVICLGLMLLGTAVCDTTTEKKLADSINHFTLNLYKELIKSGKDNVICSGFSLSSVLSMLLAGARGNTSTEISDTLGYNHFELSEQQIEDSFRHLLTQQGTNHSEYELDVANSVWLKSGFSVLQEFKSIINNNFFVEEKQLDFDNSSANAEINEWVNQKTKGRIPTLFDEPLDPSTRLVLVNAVYFKGSWLEKFDKDFTSNIPFTSMDGSTTPVPMMYINKDFRYFNSTSLNAQLLELPYTGDDVSMVIILPRNHDGLEALEHALTLDSLNEAINHTAELNVEVMIPKFNISSKMPLNDVLQSMGIVKAFSQSEADFSGINGEKNLCVSDSIQKADIEVNEEGTVAAAASAIILTESIDPWQIRFIANHPFLFAIRQKSTGIFLFIGRVANL